MMASSEDSIIVARKRSVGTVESRGRVLAAVDNGRVSDMGGIGAGGGGMRSPNGSARTQPQFVPVVTLVKRTRHAGRVPHGHRSGERVSRLGPRKRTKRHPAP